MGLDGIWFTQSDKTLASVLSYQGLVDNAISKTKIPEVKSLNALSPLKSSTRNGLIASAISHLYACPIVRA